MRKLFISACIALTATMAFTACDNDNQNNWDNYKDWREYNEKWMTEQSALKGPDGKPLYTTVVSPTDPEAFILYQPIGEVHNDNLKPLYTSTATVNYSVHLANDSLVDQGANFRFMVNSSGLISGWGLAVMQLHVGDSASFILPYDLAYGAVGSGNVPPYSNLRFDIRLVDIPYYEIRP